MKSMTKLMVVAMVLAAALVVAPAAAARPIYNGDNVYIGEKGVNLTSVFGDDPKGGTLVYYSNVATPEAATIGKTVPVTDATDFELTAADFSSIGAWYAFNTSAIADPKVKLTNQSAANGYILVDKPSVPLDVKLAGTTDSVDGKSVTRNNKIEFEIKHNIRANETGLTDTEKENYGLFMKIEVKTPDGGTLTRLGAEDLGKVWLNGTKRTTGAISLEGLKAGTYTAQAKWGNTSALDSDNSNTVTFEVLTKPIAISSSKDSVVRGKNFVVTISGDSKTNYYVYVKDASLKASEYPLILDDQPGVTVDRAKAKLLGNGGDGESDLKLSAPRVKEGAKWYYMNNTVANVSTNAGGTRTIEFNTTTETKDRQFTIRVEEIRSDDKSPEYDEVKVRVEKGTVTITASGTGVYYIGEEITLSGTCTDSEKVYLFLTGPNLGTNGVSLDSISTKVVDNDVDTFATEDVEADDTWSLKWNTAELAKSLDAGGYTVYAVSSPQGKSNLSGTEYATASLQLKSAYLTATSSGAKIAKGDDLKITGTAQGDPENVRVWIFGKNYYGPTTDLYDTATVESDGSFEYELKGGDTKEFSAGQYFVVIQHPMTKGYGINTKSGSVSGETYITGGGLQDVLITNLQASAAATALINALDSANVDDTYVKLTFDVEEAYIAIDPIGDKAAGSKFTISGTTNVAVGDKLIIDVTSSAFGPAKKTEAAGFGSVAGTATVEKGDGANKWSFEVDAADLKPDQYIVKVECIETDTTTTANFNLVEKVETTPTAEVTTTAPAGEVTTTAPAGETTTEPTPTPGFGALVALAGLGAVAFLVLRRK